MEGQERRLDTFDGQLRSFTSEYIDCEWFARSLVPLAITAMSINLSRHEL